MIGVVTTAESVDIKELEDQHYLRLKEYVEQLGGTLADGWTVTIKVRQGGKSAGSSDAYFISPEGVRYRSRTEVASALGLTKSSGNVGKRPRPEDVGQTHKKPKRMDHTSAPTTPSSPTQKHTYLQARRKNVQTEDKCIQVTRAEIRASYDALRASSDAVVLPVQPEQLKAPVRCEDLKQEQHSEQPHQTEHSEQTKLVDHAEEPQQPAPVEQLPQTQQQTEASSSLLGGACAV